MKRVFSSVHVRLGYVISHCAVFPRPLTWKVVNLKTYVYGMRYTKMGKKIGVLVEFNYEDLEVI